MTYANENNVVATLPGVLAENIEIVNASSYFSGAVTVDSDGKVKPAEGSSTGVTEWTSGMGTVTGSIMFGAALSADEAITLSSVGSSTASIIFSTKGNNLSYGLSQTAVKNWEIKKASYLSILNGTYEVKNSLYVGTNSSGSSSDRSEGNLSLEAGTLNIGSGGIVLKRGTVNINGGTVNQSGTMEVGNSTRSDGAAIFNINAGNVSANAVNMGQFAQPSTLNINGGTLTTGSFSYYSGSSSYSVVIAFSGGTLKASKSTTSFIPDGASTTVSIGASGGTIDTDGHEITISETVSGTGALTVTGGGKLTLSAAPTLTGVLTLTSGTTLDLNEQTDTFASATIGGVVTNGTLSVTGKATFTAGAVIDVGDLALSDGAVVMACGSVEGLENLTVTKNGTAVNFNVKFDSTNGIVLRFKGFVIRIASADVNVGETDNFDDWLTENGYDIYTDDGITAMQNAIVTKNATTQMSPLEAYLLGYDDEDAAPNFAAEPTSTGFTLTFGNNTPNTLTGLTVTYAVQKSSDNSEWAAATTSSAGSGALSLAFDNAGLYNRLVATIAAAE